MMENRAQALFWIELVELKGACEYVRRYRDRLNTILVRVAVIRSVVSVAALGGWITTNLDPRIWAAVIVMVQVAEAVQRAIPFGARYAATNSLSASFDALFLDALRDWEEIAAGNMDDKEIRERRHRLVTARLAADRKAAPHGLPRMPRLELLAKQDAVAYFKMLYPEEL
jgi:hypothetical protein